jgi:hypothetical protein
MKKNLWGVNTMKRNKRTTVIAHEDLAPLTEHILAKMGKEGLAIRKRLKTFYRTRTLSPDTTFDQSLESPVCEIAPN